MSYIEKNDPFWLFKKLTVDTMLHNPRVKKFSRLIFIFNISFIFLQCVYILRSTEKKQLLLTYFPTMGVNFFMTFQIFVFIALEKTIGNIFNELYSLIWPLDICDASSRDRFLKEFNFLRMTLFVVGFSLTSLVVFISPLFSDDRDIFLIKEMFPTKYGKIVDFFFLTNFLLLACMAFSIACCLFYAICSVKFQLSLLGLYISKMKNLETNQEFVAEKLRIIVIRHVSITTFIKKVIKMFWGLLQVEVYMLLIVDTSMIFFFINSFSLSDDWKANLRSISFSTTSVLLTIHFTALFIQVPDMTGKIFDELLELPWYSYNRKNCTTLLILLENSVNPIYINLLTTGRLDASSVAKYIKIMYSTATVLYGLKE